jgi:hypothetical protein
MECVTCCSVNLTKLAVCLLLLEITCYKNNSTTDITLHILERVFLLVLGLQESVACRISLNMDVADSFETFIRIYQTTWRHNPEEPQISQFSFSFVKYLPPRNMFQTKAVH